MNEKSMYSAFRTEMMGMAAIGILIVHSGAVISWGTIAGKILAHGGIGVYIFMLLSAMGLCSSIAGNPDIKSFYRKRLIRIGIPFLLFSFPWYIVKDLVLSFQPIYFLGDMTTVSFWTRHTGAWFVAALIPMYLIFPFYSKWIERGKCGLKTATVILADIVLQQTLFMMCPDLLDRFSQFLQSVWVFSLGCFMKKEYDRTGKEQLWIALPFIPLYIISRIGNVNDVTVIGAVLYAYKGVLLTILFICALKLIKFRENGCFLFRIFRWMGTHSLESYLANDYLISAFALLQIEKMIPNNYVRYALIIVMGLLLSAAGFRIAKHIQHKLLPDKFSA